jgi:hypothetical protein
VNCLLTECSKTFKKAVGLKAHLKDRNTHSNAKLICPSCLNSFGTASALTAHSEAEASKCKVQRATDYRPYTDQLTGGMVDLEGKHDDDTNRYKVSQNFVEKFSGKNANPVEQVRKRLAEEEEKRKKEREAYWQGREPKW